MADGRAGCARLRRMPPPARVALASLAGFRGRLGGRSCERPDPLQRGDEVADEWVGAGEAEDEPAPGAADGGGDVDEAEAQPLRVAGALTLREGEQFQPAEQVVGEQRAEQIG